MSAQRPHTMTARLTEVVVTIVGTNTKTGAVMCRDSFGNEFEIDGTLRRKGTGFPDPGERWMLAKRGSVWVPEVQIGAPAISTIEGSRDGLHPVTVQILEALSDQGLVFDATVSPTVPGTPDPVPPVAPTDPDYGAEVPDEPDSAEVVPDSNPDAIPASDNGPAPDDGDLDYSNTWVPLYLGTYNVKKDLGPRAARDDLIRYAKSRVQVFATQEMHSEARDAGCAWLGNHGWDYYRPKGGSFTDENTLFWREDQFTLLDKDSYPLTPSGGSGSHRPPRCLNWVKLRQEVSKRIFYFGGTHYDCHIEGHQPGQGGGHPRPGAHWQPWVQGGFEQTRKTALLMQNLGRTAPVFTAGDFNLNWFADARVRDPRFPYAKFKTVNTRANWGLISHHPGYGTHGNRYIDQVWFTRPKHWQVRAVDQWILTGYASDHRPVLVKASLRSAG